MNAAEIRKSVRSFYDDIWNRHDDSAMTSLLATEFTFRGSLGRTCQGHAAFTEYVNMVLQSLGNYRCEILDIVVEPLRWKVWPDDVQSLAETSTGRLRRPHDAPHSRASGPVGISV